VSRVDGEARELKLRHKPTARSLVLYVYSVGLRIQKMSPTSRFYGTGGPETLVG
jgi:hypothetical protein